jgi:hypothetical protein
VISFPSTFTTTKEFVGDYGSVTLTAKYPDVIGRHINSEDRKEIVRNRLKSIVGWHGVETGGAPLEFSEANLLQLLRGYPELYRQVDEWLLYIYFGVKSQSQNGQVGDATDGVDGDSAEQAEKNSGSTLPSGSPEAATQATAQP